MNNDHFGSDKDRTMPVCLSPEQLKLLTEYAKKKGMTNYNQAIEYLATEINSQIIYFHLHFQYYGSL